MSDKFSALPERVLGLEEVLELNDYSGIEEAAPVSVLPEFRLVTSFLLRRSGRYHVLGFDDEARYWVVIGRYDESEGYEAVMAANDWINEMYGERDEMVDLEITDPAFVDEE